MRSETRLEQDAAWKCRYRQYCAWDVPSGELRHVTRRPGGIAVPGYLSPAGHHVYFLDDAGGNEVGHYARLRTRRHHARAAALFVVGFPPLPGRQPAGIHGGRCPGLSHLGAGRRTGRRARRAARAIPQPRVQPRPGLHGQRRDSHRVVVGGTPEQSPRQDALSSPITSAENVRAPVLIIQRRNDTRTPARPVEMYEAKLKALGKPIEVHRFDIGHGGAGAQVEQSIHHPELRLRFADRVLGAPSAQRRPA